MIIYRIINLLLVLLILLMLLVCLTTTTALADNLGVQGTVYSITEPDMLTGIHQKLITMQKSGELERQKKAVIARSITHVLRPTPVKGVSDLQKGAPAHTHDFDPSIVLNRDIINSNGDMIARAGTRVNPLSRMHFNETLIFINGDNSSQVNWAHAVADHKDKSQQRYKIILVNGDIKVTSKSLNHRVYFDQYGRLCQRFGIKHTPTLVFQPKDSNAYASKLRVQEVQID